MRRAQAPSSSTAIVAAGADVGDVAGELAELPASARVAFGALEARSVAYERAATALGTRRRYRSAWQGFAAWCAAHGLSALPAHPDVVRLYVVSQEASGRSLSHLGVVLASIRKAHGLAGEPLPVSERLSAVLRGVRRTLGPKARHAEAIGVEELRAIAAACDPSTAMGARDRALILVLYVSALRRSELCALNLADVARSSEGYTLTIRSSKTDQSAEGATVGVPVLPDPALCPVRALDAWIALRGAVPGRAEAGPLFPSLHGCRLEGKPRPGVWRALDGRNVAQLLQRAAARAGFDPTRFRPHGLRAGLATESSRRGASLAEIKAHLRHSSLESTLRYVREGEALAPTNPGRRIA